MARSKQTAQKSTGAPAPRITLKKLTKRFHPLRTRKTSRKVADTASSSKATSIIDSVTVTIQPDVPTHVLNIQVRGPVNQRADMDKDHDEWCTACRNGGLCLCCDSCLRVVCHRCVDFPQDKGSPVKCPSCHLYLQRGGQNTAPYTVNNEVVKYKGQGSTRESFPRSVSEPLAIVSITLQGFADDGPSKVAYENVVPYLRGNACYVHVDFNFGTDQDSHSFSKRLDCLADYFETGELKRFRRFFVFLATHSDPERGDLHVAPNEQQSATAEQAFERIFCETRFGEQLKKSRDSVLALVACGAAVGYPEPLKALRELSTRKYFRQILAFTQRDLQASFANKFVLDYTINRFIHLKQNIYSYIYDHQGLGAHTNLVVFCSGSPDTAAPTEATATQIFWSHNGLRPYGNPCPQQCPGCHALKPWTPKTRRDAIEHRCKNCDTLVVYRPNPKAAEITPPGRKGAIGERGTWWMTKL